jgi:hypothetical protein
MLLSLHVPKCGGTSFAHMLQRVYGPRLWLDYGVVFTRSQARRELVPPGTACIHGHFEADAFSDLYPGAPLITWVRHPVERLASNYYYFLRCPGKDDFFSRKLHEEHLDIRQFAELEGMRNVMARHFAGVPLEAFRFVGVMERYADSARVFNKALGIDDQGPLPNLNTNPDRTTPNYAISKADFEHILSLNITDLRLYEEARRGLDAAVDGMREPRPASTGPSPWWSLAFDGNAPR